MAVGIGAWNDLTITGKGEVCAEEKGLSKHSYAMLCTDNLTVKDTAQLRANAYAPDDTPEQVVGVICRQLDVKDSASVDTSGGKDALSIWIWDGYDIVTKDNAKINAYGGIIMEGDKGINPGAIRAADNSTVIVTSNREGDGNSVLYWGVCGVTREEEGEGDPYATDNDARIYVTGGARVTAYSIEENGGAVHEVKAVDGVSVTGGNSSDDSGALEYKDDTYVIAGTEDTANYILFKSAEKEIADYPLYFDGETAKLYKKFSHSFPSGEATFSDPVEVPGAVCEKNKLTLTSDFQFYTTGEDGLALGEGTTLYVPEGASPSVHSAVSGIVLNENIGGTSGIYCCGNNTINVDGSLTVTAGDGVNIDSWGITDAGVGKAIDITGKGSLTVYGGNIAYDETVTEDRQRGTSCAIGAYDDIDISIAELNAIGGNAYYGSFGIVADYPGTEPHTLTVSGGSRVAAKGGRCDNAEESISCGGAANHLIIKDNSSVTMYVPGTGEKYYAAGLMVYNGENYGSGKIELSNGGSFTAKVGDTATSSGVAPTYVGQIDASIDGSSTFTAEGATFASLAELMGISVVSDGKTVTYDSEKYGYVDADGNLVKKISVEPADAPEVGGFPFTDVKAADWFYNVIKAVYNEGLMRGVTETEFAPKAALTRGMVTTIIGRMGAAEAADGPTAFTDVDADAYYAPYVAWAAENGIVSGFTDGTFRPDENVTREQTAAILYRYMQYIGADVSVGEDTNILSFTDAGEISEYAFPALQWACGAGVIHGYGDGTLAPKAGITRAEFAAMISGVALTSDTGADRTAATDASGFVSLAEAVPDAIMEIRYYSTYNFVGDRIDGYEEPCALLTKEAAAALKNASDDAVANGYRLKIYDAYRPQTAVQNFVDWAEDTDDTRMKAYFYPELDKSVLFDQGYIAEKSGHSRGSTVDLTLFDMSTGKELDMGGTFDYFGELSHPDYTGELTEEQIQNRNILRDIMLENGFKPLDTEWWHFTLANEPYPDTYFDFPVSGRSVGIE